MKTFQKRFAFTRDFIQCLSFEKNEGNTGLRLLQLRNQVEKDTLDLCLTSTFRIHDSVVVIASHRDLSRAHAAKDWDKLMCMLDPSSTLELSIKDVVEKHRGGVQTEFLVTMFNDLIKENGTLDLICCLSERMTFELVDPNASKSIMPLVTITTASKTRPAIQVVEEAARVLTSEKTDCFHKTITTFPTGECIIELGCNYVKTRGSDGKGDDILAKIGADKNFTDTPNVIVDATKWSASLTDLQQKAAKDAFAQLKFLDVECSDFFRASNAEAIAVYRRRLDGLFDAVTTTYASNFLRELRRALAASVLPLKEGRTASEEELKTVSSVIREAYSWSDVSAGECRLDEFASDASTEKFNLDQHLRGDACTVIGEGLTCFGETI